jgi:YD repeat-containing protein
LADKLIKELIKIFLFCFILLSPTLSLADQSQYYYDDLGRLVGVADGAGNMAVYVYDPVGNLLSVQRYTTATTGIGIFLILPSSGTIGTSVEIRGYGFDPTASNNQVSFNGTTATVIFAATNSLVVTVPAGATTGPVVVTNTNGTATSPQPFTVLQLPVIQGVDPGTVAQRTTNYTVISGFNLNNATSVQFTQNGITGTLLSGGTATQLPISLVVASNVPVGSYGFSVTTSVGTNQSGIVTVTVKSPSPAASTARPLSVFMPSSGQVRPTGPESVSTLALSVFMTPSANESPSGVESIGTLPVSVFIPPPANQSPSGPESIGTAPLSIFLPSLMNQSPSGPESAATFPLSIYFPASDMVSPSGSLAVVAPPESVSMP